MDLLCDTVCYWFMIDHIVCGYVPTGEYDFSFSRTTWDLYQSIVLTETKINIYFFDLIPCSTIFVDF